jgi:hypothetical protein
MSAATLQMRQVKPLSSQRGIVRGYKLEMTYPGFPFREPAFATISPASADVSCHGVVHLITANDMRQIVRTEGGGGVAPGYELIEVAVTPYESTAAVRAFALTTRQPKVLLGPSERYATLVANGACRAADWRRWACCVFLRATLCASWRSCSRQDRRPRARLRAIPGRSASLCRVATGQHRGHPVGALRAADVPPARPRRVARPASQPRRVCRALVPARDEEALVGHARRPVCGASEGCHRQDKPG